MSDQELTLDWTGKDILGGDFPVTKESAIEMGKLCVRALAGAQKQKAKKVRVLFEMLYDEPQLWLPE